MKLLSSICLLYGILVSVHALPNAASAVMTGVSQTVFNKLTHYAQWAAASYCESNFQNGNTSSLITCAAGNCPAVEQANAKSVLEWQKPASDTGLFDDVPGFVAIDPVNKEIVVSIRGTIPNVNDIVTDIDFPLMDAPEYCHDCQVHQGFYSAWLRWRTDVVQAVLRAQSQNKGYKVVVTGHSLGGGVATLAAATLRDQKVNADLYTYGSPRVGNDHFASVVSGSTMGSVWRVTHLDDPIPHLPPSIMGFRHVYPEYWLSDGTPDQNKYMPGDVEICLAGQNGNENNGCANTQSASLGLDILATLGFGDPAGIFDFLGTMDAHHHYFQNIDNCAPGAGFQ